MWPTNTTTTTTANLSIPSGPPSTSNVPNVTKLPASRQPSKMLAKLYLTPVPLSSPIHSDVSSDEDWEATKLKERKDKQDLKRTTEEERMRKEEENTLLHKSCVPDLLSAKPNPPLTDLSVPAPEEKNKCQEKNKDCVTDYYCPSTIYVASYEDDAPALVKNLVPEPTLNEKKDTSKT